MKSFSFLITFILYCWLRSTSQAQTITWGDELNASIAISMADFFEFSDGQSVGILAPDAGSSESPNLTLVDIYAFDKALKTTKVVALKSLSWAEKYRYEFAFRTGEQLRLFVSTEVGTQKERSLEVLLINHSTLKIDKLPTPLYKAKVAPTERLGVIRPQPLGVLLRSSMRDFNHVVSQDSTCILMYANVTPAKSESQHFHLSCYTQDLKLKWSSVVQTPFPANTLFNMKWKVNDQGNALVLGMRYLSPAEGGSTNPNLVQHDLLLVKNGEAAVQSFALYSREHYLHSIDLTAQADGNFLLVGLYSDYQHAKGARGMYSQVLDVKGEKLGTAQFSDLNMEPLMEDLGKIGRGFFVPASKKGSAEMSAFGIRQLISRNDNSTILVAEQHSAHFGSTRELLGRPNANTYESETYHNILVVALDENGMLKWRVIVPRYQHLPIQYGFFTSVKVMVEPDRLHLLFNDHLENVPPRQPNEYEAFHGNFLGLDKEGALKIITVDNTGKTSGGVRIVSKELDLNLRPLCFVQLDPKRMHIYGQKAGKSKIGLIRF